MKHTTSRKNKKLPVEVTEEEFTLKQRRKFAMEAIKEQKEIFGGENEKI